MKNAKNLLVVLFALLLALSLCACGQVPASPTEEATAPETPAPIEPAPAETSEEPEAAAEPEVSAEPEEPAAPAYDLEELSVTMVGRPIAELLEIIGEPLSTDYAPSCLGSGEDGELVYEDFTVYTYREGEVETVEEIYYAD